MKVHMIESLRFLLLIPGIILSMIFVQVCSQNNTVSLGEKVEGILISSAIGDSAGEQVNLKVVDHASASVG